MITFYVIYDHPKDFPAEFVGRRQHVTPWGAIIFDNDLFARGPTIEHVRAKVPAGCVLFKRDASDDPAIAETWME